MLFPHNEQMNVVSWHTQAGDLAEYRAIRAAIPGSDVRINGTKSMIGHLLGAAGAVEAIATIQAIHTGAFPCVFFHDYIFRGVVLTGFRVHAALKTMEPPHSFESSTG